MAGRVHRAVDMAQTRSEHSLMWFHPDDARMSVGLGGLSDEGEIPLLPVRMQVHQREAGTDRVPEVRRIVCEVGELR